MTQRTLMTSALLACATCSTAGLDRFFYHPDSTVYTTPAQDGLAYEDIQFSSADGTKLSGWFIPAKGKARGTVVHFHGNAQNMSAHYSFVSWLPANGFNLFVFDYRGYGKSDGKPSRQGVYEDSVAALEYIKSRKDIDQSKIIVFGQSIGGANALAVLGSHPFDGIVGIATDSAFSSYKSVAAEHAGWLKPFAYCLIGNKHSPSKHIAGISPTPLLIIHGTQDRVASYKHAQKLFEKAQEPKELWTIKGGGHTAALGPFKNEYAPKLYARFMEWTE
ncbi:alpha/beta hydrolase [Pontiella sulfatireligans]|uniref:Multifunctional-autoprocessing repeats-in-toxin n=1 Tax=Pontiella sulfatireligans TaxID=2750658 RepID=A0A6C2UJ87_9BACT|nr:alpha/beta hydrolase [Pontiella sulfatireligans]VGO20292.1 Multifunctional-autoprocessing repeats-in-toxin [Pontiella sulfatireligans]